MSNMSEMQKSAANKLLQKRNNYAYAHERVKIPSLSYYNIVHVNLHTMDNIWSQTCPLSGGCMYYAALYNTACVYNMVCTFTVSSCPGFNSGGTCIEYNSLPIGNRHHK